MPVVQTGSLVAYVTDIQNSYLFGPRKEEVRGKWRTLNRVEALKLHFLGRSMWCVWGTAARHSVFWWGGVKKGDSLEDLDVDGKTALKWNFEKCDTVCLDWIDLAEDRDGWRELFGAVMAFGLHKMRGIS
jgi:hypothetical protein